MLNILVQFLPNDMKGLVVTATAIEQDEQLISFIKSVHTMQQAVQLDLFDTLDIKLRKLLLEYDLMTPFGVCPRIHSYFHVLFPGQSPY